MPELRRLVFVLALAALAAVALATAQFLFLRRPAPQRPEPPPEPRLQAAPREDLAELRRRQSRILDSYGWSDRGRGFVRVPIERAMELLLEEDGRP
jgi:hypothetical protein